MLLSNTFRILIFGNVFENHFRILIFGNGFEIHFRILIFGTDSHVFITHNATCSVCRLLLSGATFPIVWIDNVSKNVARQIPRIGKGVFTSMMWTGLAIKLYDGPALRRDLVLQDRRVVPAMPGVHYPDFPEFITLAESSVNTWTAAPPLFFQSSMVYRYKVRSVPPKVDVLAEPKAERRLRLRNSRDGLHRTSPWEIWQHNIGSNEGLIDVIRQYMAETNLKESPHYHVWLVDVNIYTRVYKVHRLPLSLRIMLIYV